MIEVEKSKEWDRRRKLYKRNNSVVFKIFMKLYYEFEELIWLLVCVGILVVILKMFFPSF